MRQLMLFLVLLTPVALVVGGGTSRRGNLHQDLWRAGYSRTALACRRDKRLLYRDRIFAERTLWRCRTAEGAEEQRSGLGVLSWEIVNVCGMGPQLDS